MTTLNQLMADPEVLADYNRLNELAQERSEIEELVQSIPPFSGSRAATGGQPHTA